MADGSFGLEEVNASRRSLLKWAGLGSAGLAALAAGCSTDAQEMEAAAEEAASAAPEEDRAMAIMGANENPYGPFPSAIAAMQEKAGDVHRYAWPLSRAFQQKIAEKEGVEPDQVLVTNGSTPILNLFGEWVATQEGEMITSEATYEGVPRTALAYGADVVFTPLDAEMNYDLEAMMARIGPNTSSVYVCNPNNPTGRTVDAAKLREFAIEASKTAPVFLDEAYIEMTDDFPNDTTMSLVKEGHNVMVVRTFSKLYGMAGGRLGYAVVSKPLLAELQKVGGRIGMVNRMGLVAGAAALNDPTYFAEARAKNAAARAKLVAMAADLGRPIAPNPQGNFIYMDVGMPNPEFAAQMREKGVAVVGRSWPNYDNWSRICIGLDWEIERCHEMAKQVLTSI